MSHAALSHADKPRAHIPAVQAWRQDSGVVVPPEQQHALREVFMFYTSWAEKHNFLYLSRSQFLRFCRDTLIMRGELDSVSLSLVYDKALQVQAASPECDGGARLTRDVWVAALQVVASVLYPQLAAQEAWERLVAEHVLKVGVRLSSASPISDEVMMFLRICFGATVLEGYGMTESSSAMSITRPDDTTIGLSAHPLDHRKRWGLGPLGPAAAHRGQQLPAPAVLLLWPTREMGGGVCAGPAVFAGYHKDPVQTAEVLDTDGWLHTDVVAAVTREETEHVLQEFLQDPKTPRLAFHSRAAPITLNTNKSQLNTSYSMLEAVLDSGKMPGYRKANDDGKQAMAAANGSPFVAQAFVYGDSSRAQLVAIVVPDVEVMLPWAADRGLGAALVTLCGNPHVKEAVFRSQQEEARVAQLRGFEQVHALHLHPELLTEENGMLTPTFKLKRPQANTFFHNEIDAMYAVMPASSGCLALGLLLMKAAAMGTLWWSGLEEGILHVEPVTERVLAVGTAIHTP
ncbi:hypothetical protein V8C86DRAFT_2437347 [Haematococcus lacustris]